MLRSATFALALWLGLVAPVLAGVDWKAHAADDTVSVVSRDVDGSLRERTIWLLVLDGQPYIRTGTTTVWGANVLRDPNITLKLGAESAALRATRVTDPALLARIQAAFAAKYGFSDTLAGLLRGDPIVFQLTPR